MEEKCTRYLNHQSVKQFKYYLSKCFIKAYWCLNLFLRRSKFVVIFANCIYQQNITYFHPHTYTTFPSTPVNLGYLFLFIHWYVYMQGVYGYWFVNYTHWGQDKMAAVLRDIFNGNGVFLFGNLCICLKSRWNLFPWVQQIIGSDNSLEPNRR